MHLLCSLVVAVLALFPASDDAVADIYHRWMANYEKYLYERMYENLENARRNEENCKNTSNNEVSHEQTASEEAVRDEYQEPAVLEEFPEVVPQTVPMVETPAPVESENQNADTTVVPLYEVEGYRPDEALQTYLYQRLNEAGIGYFMPYAVCLIAQESTWNYLAVNPNMRDFGLLQFRIEYTPWMDWTNPYQQIDYFVQLMANRAAAGCTVSEMISRHRQSDYGPYDQGYVNDVMQHANTLVQIR